MAKQLSLSHFSTFYRVILCIARTALARCLSVHPSVCPSLRHTPVLCQSCWTYPQTFFTVWYSHHFSFFQTIIIIIIIMFVYGMAIFRRRPLMRASNAKGVRNIRDFRPIACFILEMIQDTTIVAVECEWETVYPSFRMLPFPMTLIDLEPIFQCHNIIWRQMTRKWYEIELQLQWHTNSKLNSTIVINLNDTQPTVQGNTIKFWCWRSHKRLKIRPLL